MKRIVLMLMLLAACGADTPSRLVIDGYKFPPIEVAPEAEIEIVNNDAESHTFSADDGSFDAGQVAKGEPKSVTAPSKVGSYPFHCNIHPTMKGTLTVR